jgi:hypothetical protein
VPTFPFGSLGGLGFLDSFGGGFRRGRFRLRRRLDFLLQMISLSLMVKGIRIVGKKRGVSKINIWV